MIPNPTVMTTMTFKIDMNAALTNLGDKHKAIRQIVSFSKDIVSIELGTMSNGISKTEKYSGALYVDIAKCQKQLASSS